MSIHKRCRCDKKAQRDCEHPWWVKIKHKSLRTPENPEGRLRLSLEAYAQTPLRGEGSMRKAQKWETEIRHKLDTNQWKPADTQTAEGITVRDAYDSYVERHVVPNKVQWGSARYFFERTIKEYFEKRTLASLTHQDMLNVVNDWKARYKANTVRAQVSLLRAFFNWCGEQEAWEFTPPFRWKKMHLPKAPGSKARRIPADTIDTLFAVMDPWLQDMLTLMLTTGLRQATLSRLQVKHYKPDTRELHFDELAMKARQTFTTGLPIAAVAAIERRLMVFAENGVKVTPATYIFGTPHGHQWRGCTMPGDDPVWPAPALFRAAMRAAGIPMGTFTMHNFRAEAAARVMELTKDVVKTMRFLHHHSLNQTQGYLAPLVGEHKEIAALLDLRDTGPQQGPQPTIN